MKRLAILFAFALFFLLPTSVAAAECEFRFGFETLRDLIPKIVGECLENEHYAANGNSEQQTTGGLMVWRKADNWTAFTDGYRTWINGPNGLEHRLNTERFDWEVEQAIEALPWVSKATDYYYVRNASESLRSLAATAPQVFWELMHKSWMQSDSLSLNNVYLPFLFQRIKSMADRDEALALRVIGMPFMETLEFGAEVAWETLTDIFDADPESLRQLLAHPKLRDGITTDRIALIPILHLELLQPESAAAIGALPWIHESPRDVELLRRLALASQPVFWAWMEKFGDEWIYSQLRKLTAIARVDETSALQIVRMPFLETKGSLSDSTIMTHLTFLAWSDPDRLRQLLSHPKLRGGITDDHAAIVALLILEHEHPGAAAAIEALPWVQDGVGRPAHKVLHSATAHPTEYEERTVLDLVRLASSSRQLLSSLLSKPWVQDGMNFRDSSIIETIIDISSKDRAAALSLITMPFLESIESQEYEILETLYAMSFLERSFLEAEGIQWALSHPKLAGGIADDQRATVALVSLEWQYPESAAVIWELPWVRDGIAASETSDGLALQELALNSEQVFQVLARKSWIQDGLSRDEQTVIRNLRSIAEKGSSRRDEASALKIIAMPFLEAVDGADAAAVDSLSRLHWEWKSDQGYLQQVLSHPTLRDGITDDQAVLVSVLGMVGSIAPELLDTMLAPGQVIVERRAFTFLEFGKVDLAVISPSPEASGNMDWLEHAVRTHVQFMGTPFPKSYVALWIHDRGSGGGGPMGILHVGYFRSPAIVAHEAAHTYWAVSSAWITEGAATFLEKIAENARVGSPVEPVRNQDYLVACAADTLSELDQRAHEEDQGTCPYVLGSGLFVDLYRSLGDEAFRQSFRRLYLKMHRRVHDFECKGLERGVCYVKIAFVTDAAPQAAAIALPIINRWYYGSESGAP